MQTQSGHLRTHTLVRGRVRCEITGDRNKKSVYTKKNMADAKKRARVSREDVVKVLDDMDVGEIEDVTGVIANADLNIPGLLGKADRRNMRTVSKEFYHPGRKCLDAGELRAMRSETEPCKNTARVMYNPQQGIQRALMCAIMSVDKDLHVDVEEGHWEQFQENKSVKCFDDNYALCVTVLRDVERDVQSGKLAKQTLKCKGGYRELETAFVAVGPDGVPTWIQDPDLAKKVQTVRFQSEPTVIGATTFYAHTSLLELPQMPMVERVEEHAFAGCVSLEHVGRMESVQSLEIHAFACCHKLRDAPVMPELKTIGDFAFECCYALHSMPDLSKVTKIGGFAFSHCHGLRRVYIPENVKHVWRGAFWGCANLSELQAQEGDFYSSFDVSKTAFLSCPKLAGNRSLLENGFRLQMPWVNGHLLEEHESSYSWILLNGNLTPYSRTLSFEYSDQGKTQIRAIFDTLISPQSVSFIE